ncbi:MAG: FtsW/RodA/SpoVE family cell cycle protein [Coprococcus sp.]|nr:FtsW/RodA/SpoVE family cell cycle protein [Coprococcus sp.]
MVNIVVELSKYLMIVMIAVYTFECFAVFSFSDEYTKKSILLRQNVLMFMIHFVAFLVMYLQTEEKKMLGFYGMQVILFLAILILYARLYPKVSRLVVNNMCMLLAIGFIMITRLSYSLAVKQFIIAGGAVAVSLAVPVVIRRMKILSEWRKLYAVAGVVLLGIVIVIGSVSHGAMLGIVVAGINIQPSELVKIIFVFFVAASLKDDRSFRNVVITTTVAALHVLILVVSKDLGAALIIFAVYLVMLYVATQQPLYVFAGVGAGSVASVAAYYLFSHVRVRVIAWKDPFASYHEGGQQVAQSLMAIGTGSWFGMGLCQGAADKIPVSESDFIFSAIAEEMGLIFAICLILICVSVYIMFLNIAMQLHDRFYKLVALGLGTCYIFQTFLTIGGVTKFIPSTGVTLPLVSYGGSSVLSTVIMFGIIQGLYILREDEEEDIERKKAKRPARTRPGFGPETREPSRRKTAEAPKEAGRRASAGSGHAKKAPEGAPGRVRRRTDPKVSEKRRG